MKVFLLFIILLVTVTQITAQNNAPEVTNVTFNQRTDGFFIVDVYYDLNDAEGDTMLVTMQVSDDNGTTWSFTCNDISGDVGAEILSGAGKHIVWDFGMEHPQTFGDAFRIRIIADDHVLTMGTVTDIDGNVYQTVKIGLQWWMAENLKMTHYRNGGAIPHVTDSAIWPYLSTGAYCNYNNDTSNVTTYGRLYNWYAVDDSRNIAPAGWHIPTDDEWQTLVNYLGGSSVAGGKMKEIGTVNWVTPNTGATNESGFTALPGGYRRYGPFGGIGEKAAFWSSTDYFYSSMAFSRYLYYDKSSISKIDDNVQIGLSVRCVRD